MPDGVPIPASAAGPSPAAGGMIPQPPRTPPFGNTPAVTPTQNQGLEAAGIQQLGVAIRILTDSLPKLGAGSEAGQAVISALKTLSRHVKPGAVTSAGEANQLQKAQLQNVQNAALLNRLRQAGGPPGAGGAPGAAPAMPPRPGMVA